MSKKITKKQQKIANQLPHIRAINKFLTEQGIGQGNRNKIFSLFRKMNDVK